MSFLASYLKNTNYINQNINSVKMKCKAIFINKPEKIQSTRVTRNDIWVACHFQVSKRSPVGIQVALSWWSEAPGTIITAERGEPDRSAGTAERGGEPDRSAGHSDCSFTFEATRDSNPSPYKYFLCLSETSLFSSVTSHDSAVLS